MLNRIWNAVKYCETELDLALSRSLVGLMGGTTGFETPTRGARFRFTLLARSPHAAVSTDAGCPT